MRLPWVCELNNEQVDFAVAMDFCPEERMGQLSIKTLFSFSPTASHH